MDIVQFQRSALAAPHRGEGVAPARGASGPVLGFYFQAGAPGEIQGARALLAGIPPALLRHLNASEGTLAELGLDVLVSGLVYLGTGRTASVELWMSAATGLVGRCSGEGARWLEAYALGAGGVAAGEPMDLARVGAHRFLQAEILSKRWADLHRAA